MRRSFVCAILHDYNHFTKMNAVDVLILLIGVIGLAAIVMGLLRVAGNSGQAKEEVRGFVPHVESGTWSHSLRPTPCRRRWMRSPRRGEKEVRGGCTCSTLALRLTCSMPLVSQPCGGVTREATVSRCSGGQRSTQVGAPRR